MFKRIIEFLKKLLAEVPLSKPKPIRRKYRKLGRNEPCRCGSGLKYKRCCWQQDDRRGLV